MEMSGFVEVQPLQNAVTISLITVSLYVAIFSLISRLSLSRPHTGSITSASCVSAGRRKPGNKSIGVSENLNIACCAVVF